MVDYEEVTLRWGAVVWPFLKESRQEYNWGILTRWLLWWWWANPGGVNVKFSRSWTLKNLLSYFLKKCVQTKQCQWKPDTLQCLSFTWHSTQFGFKKRIFWNIYIFINTGPLLTTPPLLLQAMIWWISVPEIKQNLLKWCCQSVVISLRGTLKNRVRSPTFGLKLGSSTGLGSSCFSLAYTEGLPQILKSSKIPWENVQAPPPLTICRLSLCMCKAWRLKNDSHRNSAALHSSRSPWSRWESRGWERVDESTFMICYGYTQVYPSLAISLQVWPCQWS